MGKPRPRLDYLRRNGLAGPVKIEAVAYLACETARQHAHDGPRLTGAGDLARATATLAMFERVWGADPAFLKQHGELYARAVQEQRQRRVRALLGLGRTAEALRELRDLEDSPVLYHGESRYGVTLHKMEPEIDAGAIAGQALFDIEDKDTALTLTLKCVKAGLPLIHELLRSAAETGAIPMQPQDLTERRYYGKDVPEGGWLDWSRSARAVFNFIRACDYFPFRSPWGHTKARLAGEEIGIIKAALLGQPAGEAPGTVGARFGEAVRVACGDEWIGVTKAFSAGKYRDAVEALQPGMPLEGGPEGRGIA